MEFWGVEVKAGKPLHVKSDPDSYIHISQAALGDIKNAQSNDRVLLKVKTGPFDIVVGTLSLGRCDQTALDLIFEKDFVLSHSSTGSVFFCGYKTDAVREDDSGVSESEDELENEIMEEAKLLTKENGKVAPKSDKAIPLLSKPTSKPSASKVEISTLDMKAKGKPALAEKIKGSKEKSQEEDEDEDDEDDDDDDDDEDESDDAMMASGSDEEDLESDEEDSDEEDSQEDEPKPAGKKRPASSLLPASVGKKGKADTPGKAEVKTPVPLFTPKHHSGKKDSATKKTPGKETSTTPGSGKKLGQFVCQPCNKNFTSESALSQHKIAKHKS